MTHSHNAYSHITLRSIHCKFYVTAILTYSPCSPSLFAAGQLNTGTHQLHLFLPPVPRISSIPLHPGTGDWQRYGRANLRIYIFRDLPRPGSLSPSDRSEDENDDDKIPPLVGCACSHGNLISTILCLKNVLAVFKAILFTDKWPWAGFS